MMNRSKNNKIQNILILLIYSIKIFLISSIMILVMKLCFYQISAFQIHKTVTLFLIITSGLLTYFLTCGFLSVYSEFISIPMQFH